MMVTPNYWKGCQRHKFSHATQWNFPLWWICAACEIALWNLLGYFHMLFLSSNNGVLSVVCSPWMSGNFFFHFWYHLKMIHDVKTILSLSIFFFICSSSFCQWSNPFMLCWSFKYFSFLAGKCSWSDCWSLLGGLGVANRILFFISFRRSY